MRLAREANASFEAGCGLKASLENRLRNVTRDLLPGLTPESGRPGIKLDAFHGDPIIVCRSNNGGGGIP
jgi:hypothetical protein